MGTTPMGEEQALQRVLDAVARLDVRVLVNAGMHLDTARLRRSDNTILSRYVRHAAVLPAARLLVTHAGLGSVSMALSFGVPMVCLPLGREQPVNAERVAALGAGRVVAGTADADAIAGAITNVIDDAAYAEAARGMAGKIGAVAAAGPAARLLEDCASGIDADPGKPASG